MGGTFIPLQSVWLNRNQIAKLFGRDIKTIGKHINNTLNEELDGISVVANFATTAADDKTYQVEHYNLEMITSVGCRVKSRQGIQFRQWANYHPRTKFPRKLRQYPEFFYICIMPMFRPVPDGRDLY